MDRGAGPTPARSKGKEAGLPVLALSVLALASASSGYAQSLPPANGGEEGQAVYHTLKAGETLSVVARRYGVSLSELIAANEIDDSDHVRAGRRLAIPRSQRKKSAQKAAPTQVAQRPVSDGRISMSFSNVDVRDVLEQIADYSHVDIVITPGTKGEISLNLRSRSADEAIRLAAAAGGLTVTRVGGAYIVGPVAEVQKAAGEFHRAELLPLRYLTPADAVTALARLVPALTATAGKNAIYISGTPADLAAARDLIARLDVPPAPPAPAAPERQIFPLVSIDPDMAERVLQRAFPDIRVERENRTLIITGTPSDLQAVGRALQSLDVAPPPAPVVPEEPEVYVHKLKYLNAEIAAETLTKALPNTVKISVAPEPTAPPQAVFNPLSSGLGGGGSGGSGGGSGLGGSGGGSGFGGGGGGGQSSGGQGGGQGGQGGGAQQQKLSRATRLIIIGPRSQIAMARDIIEQTDVPQPIVRIEAAIVEVNRSNIKDLGIEWDFGPNSNGDGLIGFSVPGGKGLDVRGDLSRSALTFTAQLRALVTKTQAKVLASPNISVVDNEDASMFIGSLLRFPGNTATSQGTTVQGTESLPVGIALLVRPRIHDDGSVTLKVHPVVSDVSAIDPQTHLPQTTSREADTTVRLMRGEQLVIGGLTRTETSRSERKVPILGDLPFGIGEFFTSRNRTERKTEIVVIIRAYPVLTDAAPAKDFRKGVDEK